MTGSVATLRQSTGMAGEAGFASDHRLSACLFLSKPDLAQRTGVSGGTPAIVEPWFHEPVDGSAIRRPIKARPRESSIDEVAIHRNLLDPRDPAVADDLNRLNCESNLTRRQGPGTATGTDWCGSQMGIS